MVFEQKTLQEVLDYIKLDRDENRFVSRVFFVSNLETYYSFVKTLSEKADVTVRLSDERFCKGSDTVPDLKALIAFLDENKDKDILVPHLAEYLRIGEVTEKNSACLYSILNRHVHSKKRVWIPIFLAKGLFQSIVGPLDEERFGHSLIEINDTPVDFSATAYSKMFAKQKGLVNAVGIREWLSLWDDQKIKTGMSFATRQIKQITPTSGDYTLKTVADPYEYIKDALVDENAKLTRQLGTEEQWTSLIPFVAPNSTMDEIISHALNMHFFDYKLVIGNWHNLTDNEKWIFYLWYRLGLNKSSDYISFAVERSANCHNLLDSLECAIIDCQDNSNFDEWIQQREKILKEAGHHAPSRTFIEKLDQINDTRVKLKILTGRTHEERTKILELVSTALNEGKIINDFKALLQNKYPDLLLYLNPSNYLSGEVKEYMTEYKTSKIADSFSLQLSNAAGQIDCLSFDTRGSILYSLKNSVKSPYFLWFDGLGIEWVDMLLEKIRNIDSTVSLAEAANIVTAVLPTVTKVNMDKADPETISEKKIDDLDTLSHIKDKSDCNYFSIVAKQFELIGTIARKIVETIKTHPDMEVIVTADHGMSRMAAKGFHFTQGVNPPPKAEVFNHGRYCILSSEAVPVSVSNTKKDGNILAFCTHNHFTFSGYAPGEVHGGATPEEWLIPVLHFAKYNKYGTAPKFINYTLVSSEVFLGIDGTATLSIKTDEPAKSLAVDFNGRIINCSSVDFQTWAVKISGLSAGNNYQIRIYPNDLFSEKEETIFVKRKGLIVDDDL